jgi:hypothetical protein
MNRKSKNIKYLIIKFLNNPINLGYYKIPLNVKIQCD